ncbi:hypothetical protein NP493_374g01032 [Ridgeia piscesae]|uniref:Alkaline phosphatase n=1 Tax=Ridgeia piscesae TaxID=27915 RepID=A0AAD9NV72_RIDPI|nr:hypothetical protein NP493_374g01032 [Ridgeia piscesae]
MATNTREAKNVILFVGDGMGVSTVTAARIRHGQLAGRPGEETRLHLERFPHVALIKTYTVDHQVPDSAATATAFLCGVKANFGTVGLDPRAHRGDCSSGKGRNLTCIVELAQKAGKSTGFITTARVTHATPGPLYASAADRDWETDSSLSKAAIRHGCTDIASQLLRPVGRDIDVILGGGRGRLMPTYKRDPEHTSLRGLRQDGRDLIKEWISSKHAAGKSARYVWNDHEFSRIQPSSVDSLMGLFEFSHMQYDSERHLDKAGEPSLLEMVEKAILILQKNKNGFFLMIEGARIDHAHHGNTARRALEETLAMDAAVERALELVDTDDTLVIVTADHSHPLSIGSYATRGNPILGLTDWSNEHNGNNVSDVDNLPYTTLVYGNGPGYVDAHPRRNIINVNTQSTTYRQASAVPLRIVSHDGSDVAAYAVGPMSHLLHGVHEQHYIFHVMAHAACLLDSPGLSRRKSDPRCTLRPTSRHRSNSAQRTVGLRALLLLTAVLWWCGFN